MTYIDTGIDDIYDDPINDEDYYHGEYRAWVDEYWEDSAGDNYEIYDDILWLDWREADDLEDEENEDTESG